MSPSQSALKLYSENENEESRNSAQLKGDSVEEETNLQSNFSNRSDASTILTYKGQTNRGRTIKPAEHLNDYIVYNTWESEHIIVPRMQDKKSLIQWGKPWLSEEAEMWERAMEKKLKNYWKHRFENLTHNCLITKWSHPGEYITKRLIMRINISSLKQG